MRYSRGTAGLSHRSGRAGKSAASDSKHVQLPQVKKEQLQQLWHLLLLPNFHFKCLILKHFCFHSSQACEQKETSAGFVHDIRSCGEDQENSLWLKHDEWLCPLKTSFCYIHNLIVSIVCIYIVSIFIYLFESCRPWIETQPSAEGRWVQPWENLSKYSKRHN